MKKVIIFFILILLLLAILAAFFLNSNSREDANNLTLFGNVDVRQVDIGFRVPGQVAQLFFEEGDLVKKNSLMAILDPSPYDQKVKEASANVQAIQVSYSNAEKLLKRRLELIQIGGVSAEDLENSQTNYDQLKANLAQAKAALAIAQDNLAYVYAYAPTDGFILTRIREPGTVVKEGDPVYTLSVSSPVWIRAFVNERHLGLVYPGMKASIYTDTSDGKIYTGKVGFISPVAEFTPKTVETTQLRTDLVYRLRIYTDNPDTGLRQGMPVTVMFDLRQPK